MLAKRAAIFILATFVAPLCLFFLIYAVSSYVDFHHRLSRYGDSNGCVSNGDGRDCSWIDAMNPPGLAGLDVLLAPVLLVVFWGPFTSVFLLRFWNVTRWQLFVGLVSAQLVASTVAFGLLANGIARALLLCIPLLGLFGLVCSDCFEWIRKRIKIRKEAYNNSTEKD